MLKLFPEINNFIILRYQREVNSEPIPKKVFFTKEEYDGFLACQGSVFEFAKQQIHHHYPKAQIHVLTNLKDGKDNNFLTHHYIDFLPNHTMKFKVFGLLKEAAMYLDNDIYLNHKFTSDHLPKTLPFNCYSFSWTNTNLQDMSPVQLPCRVNNVLNAGVMWIPNPHESIVQELEEMHKTYFDHKEWLLARNMWTNVDEWALSLYVYKNRIPVTIPSNVNVNRGDNHNKPKCQSIHYTGIKGKRMMFKEVDYFKKLNQ